MARSFPMNAWYAAAWDVDIKRALLTGTPCIVRERFEHATGATLVSLVPTHLRRFDVSEFRTVLLGGQAPPTERVGFGRE